MTVWHPATAATVAQAVRAKQLLHSSLDDGSWGDGKVLAEENGVQFRAAYHPNASGSGRHPGVEVWLPEAAPMVAVKPSAPTEGERELVLAEGEQRGWPREELNASVAIESGWDPASHNVQQFGGLIGFSPGFARKHVGSPQALWSLSIAQQAPLVGKYFDGVGKKWRVPGDTYLALAAPAFVGASDSTIVYARGTKAWEQNPGWRGPDGEITAGSIRAVCLRKMQRLKGGAPVAAPPKGPTVGSSLLFSEYLEHLRSAMVLDALNGFLFRLGPEATRVVVDYQTARDLSIDGIVGKETLRQVTDDLARNASS